MALEPLIHFEVVCEDAGAVANIPACAVAGSPAGCAVPTTSARRGLR
ncbi:MAG: hypothetical protein ACLP52_13095 [Streptosporangiaceae bacterium]